jgi:predicted ThiF/HesA family dinucleotide-utilizing enzyme
VKEEVIFTAKVFTLQGATTIFGGDVGEEPGHFNMPSNYTINKADVKSVFVEISGSEKIPVTAMVRELAERSEVSQCALSMTVSGSNNHVSNCSMEEKTNWGRTDYRENIRNSCAGCT